MEIAPIAGSDTSLSSGRSGLPINTPAALLAHANASLSAARETVANAIATLTQASDQVEVSEAARALGKLLSSSGSLLAEGQPAAASRATQVPLFSSYAGRLGSLAAQLRPNEQALLGVMYQLAIRAGANPNNPVDPQLALIDAFARRLVSSRQPPALAGALPGQGPSLAAGAPGAPGAGGAGSTANPGVAASGPPGSGPGSGSGSGAGATGVGMGVGSSGSTGTPTPGAAGGTATPGAGGANGSSSTGLSGSGTPGTPGTAGASSTGGTATTGTTGVGSSGATSSTGGPGPQPGSVGSAGAPVAGGAGALGVAANSGGQGAAGSLGSTGSTSGAAGQAAGQVGTPANQVAAGSGPSATAIPATGSGAAALGPTTPTPAGTTAGATVVGSGVPGASTPTNPTAAAQSSPADLTGATTSTGQGNAVASGKAGAVPTDAAALLAAHRPGAGAMAHLARMGGSGAAEALLFGSFGAGGAAAAAGAASGGVSERAAAAHPNALGAMTNPFFRFQTDGLARPGSPRVDWEKAFFERYVNTPSDDGVRERERAAFPVVDAGAHLGRTPAGQWRIPEVEPLLATLDALDVRLLVNLDGGWGAELEANLERYDRPHGNRFLTFAHPAWSELLKEGDAASEGLAAALRMSVDQGARGLAVRDLWSGLVRDGLGDAVLPNDPRLGELFALAGEWGLPVAVECCPRESVVPEFGADFSPHSVEAYDDGLTALITDHPGTRFVLTGVPLGDPDWVYEMLARPNTWCLLDAPIEELLAARAELAGVVHEKPERFLFSSGPSGPEGADYQRRLHLCEARRDRDGLNTTLETLARLYAGNAVTALGSLDSPATPPPEVDSPLD